MLRHRVDWLRRYPRLPLIVLVIAILLALVLLLLRPLVFGVWRSRSCVGIYLTAAH